MKPLVRRNHITSWWQIPLLYWSYKVGIKFDASAIDELQEMVRWMNYNLGVKNWGVIYKDWVEKATKSLASWMNQP